jgi:hypothetical protein
MPVWYSAQDTRATSSPAVSSLTKEIAFVLPVILGAVATTLLKRVDCRYTPVELALRKGLGLE